jgi:hypothetical protein
MKEDTFQKTLDPGVRGDDRIKYQRTAISSPRRRPGSGDFIFVILKSSSDFLHLEDFKLIAFLDVVVVFQ